MGKRGRFRQFDEAFNHADTLATYELIEAALLGEEDGYRKLHERNPELSLPYSILMANSYNNSQAAYNVYLALIELCRESGVEESDSLTLALAVQFLERSAQLDSLNYNELGEVYFMGRYVNRDTIKAREYLNLATKDQELRDRKWKDWHEWYEWYVPSLEPTQNPMKEADH